MTKPDWANQTYLTQPQLIREISKECEGEYLLHEIQDIVELLCRVTERLVTQDKKEVRLQGLGIFYPKEVSSREGVSRITGDSFKTEAYTSIAFRVSDALKKRHKKGE